jgi:hypothetical protein
MLLRLLVGLLLGTLPGWAQRPTPAALRDSATATVQQWATLMQTLGTYPADTATTRRPEATLLRHFSQPTAPVPNLLTDRYTYQQDHPTTTAAALVAALRTYYWQGFQLAFDSVRVEAVDTVAHTARVRVAVGIRGVVAQSRRAQRVGEWLLFTLKGGPNRPLLIGQISGTGQWLYGESFTPNKQKYIEDQLLTLLNSWLDPQQPPATHQRTCATLREAMASDTLFFRGTDKVLQPVAINGCQVPNAFRSIHPNRIGLGAIVIDYVTDAAPLPGGTFSADRQRFEGGRASGSTPMTYQLIGRTPVPVSAHEARQLSSWRVQKLIVQLQ